MLGGGRALVQSGDNADARGHSWVQRRGMVALSMSSWTWTTPSTTQIDALGACDRSRSTVEQRRAFDAVFGLAMQGRAVDAELLALALTMPRRARR